MKRAALISLGLLFGQAAMAEDLNEIFTRVNQFIEQKNYQKALNELGWAKKEIEKMNGQKLQEFFPNQLGDFSGDKFQTNSALGFTNVERSYKSSSGKERVDVSLIGSSGGDAAGGLGGLAQLGKMAAMFGGGDGSSETVRVAGRTATLESKGNGADLTIFLDSGSMLKLEMKGSNDTGKLRTLAEGFKINDLDNYLRGGAN